MTDPWRPVDHTQEINQALGLSRFEVQWTEWWKRETPEVDWLVEPFLVRGRSHALVAPGGTGKSLLSQGVAFALATGAPSLWSPAGPPVRTVYVDLEMQDDDLDERLSDFGYGPDTDLSNLSYLMLPDVPPLDTAEGGAVLMDHVAAFGADLVIIDTIGRVLEGGENEADTYLSFHRHTGQPLKRSGVTWLRVDHTGKDVTRGGRGTSAKNDDVDVVWELLGGGGDGFSMTLKALKRRLSWVPQQVEIDLLENPLRHVCRDMKWPIGTKEAAAELELSGVPKDADRNTAKALLAESGRRVPSRLLSTALRYRSVGAVAELLAEEPEIF